MENQSDLLDLVKFLEEIKFYGYRLKNSDYIEYDMTVNAQDVENFIVVLNQILEDI